MEIKFKKLTKSRGLTIPRDMAAHLDLEKVKQFGGIFCCPLCATKLYQEVTADE